MEYTTLLACDCAFKDRTFYAGTIVTVLGRMMGDGSALVRFPDGREAHLAAWRLTSPPARESRDARLLRSPGFMGR